MAFGGIDYAVFGTMMSSFVAIGVYFGFKGIFWSKNWNRDDSRDFLSGGSFHHILPAALSLFASYISSTTLLGVPATIYFRGSQYMVVILVFGIAVAFANYVVVPVFFLLEIRTTFAYLEKRFDRTVRLTAIGIYTVSSLLSMAMWLYIPAKGLSYLTGFNIGYTIVATGVIATSYTSFGGMRAVVTTEVFQTVIMVLAMISVVIKGAVLLGGIDDVLKINADAGHLQFFDLDPNPFTDKITFWTILIGNTTYWAMIYTTSQSVMVRYLPCRVLEKARRILWIQVPLMSLMYLIFSFSGLVLFAYYKDCDPFITRRVARFETLFVRYVSDIGGHVPGFVGFFMSGVFAASLSSVSSSLNSLATIAYEDLVKNCFKTEFSKNGSKLFVRGVAIVFGFLTMMFVGVASYAKNSLRARILMSNAFNCPIFGVFLLGLFNRKCTSRGALVGLISGVIMGLILIWSHYEYYPGFSAKHVGVKGCPRYYCLRVGSGEGDPGCLSKNYTNINPVTKPPPTSTSFNRFNDIFRLSYHLGGFVTVLLTFSIGSLVSPFTVNLKTKSQVARCLAPFLQPTGRDAEQEEDDEDV